jgi:tRNA(Arg) A34 adenosine deaminase TadA
MKSFAAWIIILIFLVVVCLLLFQTSFYRLRDRNQLDNIIEEKLINAAAAALKSNDVPVGAVLLYNDTILSTGYNTVLADSSAGSHAEINAISNAMRNIGISAFSKLNRGELAMVSTFEPCMMCRGAIIEYNIQHVLFMKDKGLFHWLKNDVKQYRYELNKKQVEGETKQDSLFKLHRDYEK